MTPNRWNYIFIGTYKKTVKKRWKLIILAFTTFCFSKALLIKCLKLVQFEKYQPFTYSKANRAINDEPNYLYQSEFTSLHYDINYLKIRQQTLLSKGQEQRKRSEQKYLKMSFFICLWFIKILKGERIFREMKFTVM